MSTELNGDSSGSLRVGTIQLDGHDRDDKDIGRSFTTRALLAGLFLGVLVNLSNNIYKYNSNF